MLDGEIRKRIRLIPINKGGFTRIITGVRVDGVFVLKDGARSELSVTVGIDREGGNYGGFDALMPAAALG